MKKLQTETNQ